ncbi:MAG: protein kinase [Polyangiaceae bacterium]
MGEGRHGDRVSRLYDPTLERTVAVKVLRHQAEEQQRRRLRAEARALARLSHPCVVAVYDLETTEGDTFVSMEYVAGGTLRNWLDTHPQARWREVVSLFLQAAEGLAAAHGAGVIHQDFKPENVLVGQDGRVRVADFGLAWIEAPETGVGAPTSRLTGGTPHYMAPEVALGLEPSPLSDQYSFCVALRDALKSRVGVGDQPVTEQLLLALERGLERNPERRWPSMQALIAALTRHLSPGSDERQRSLLLRRVDELWLKGLLAESLSGAEPLAIGLEPIFREDLQRFSVTPPPVTERGKRVASDPEELRFARRVEARSILELDDLFDGAQRSLTIIGAPGAGKTTALLALTRALLRRAQVDFAEPVPVVISLATFDPEVPVTRWLAGELHTKYGLPSRWAQQWIERRALVLMFDGLDEVPEARRDACIASLEALSREGGHSGLVITCRETVYADLHAPPELGGTVRVTPVNEALALGLLRRSQAAPLLEQWSQDPELRELLCNPLMLRLASSAGAGELQEAQGSLLRRRLYAHYVAHLLSRASDQPAARSRVALGLRWLARAMNRRGTSDVWLERLQASWLLAPWERWLARLLGATFITLGICLLGVGVQKALGLTTLPSIITSVGATVTCFALLRTFEVRAVEGLRWSWKRALRWLPAAVISCGAIGAAMGLRYWIPGADASTIASPLGGLWTNIAYTALVGVFVAFTMGLEPGNQEAPAEPGAGFRQSLITALTISLPTGVVTAVGLAYVVMPLVLDPLFHPGGVWNNHGQLAVRTGVLFGAVLFFVYGGAAIAYHCALRLVLALRTPLPLALVPFLDDAAHAGILRRVGGGYLFMHRELLDYLASLDDDSLKLVGADATPSPVPAR